MRFVEAFQSLGYELDNHRNEWSAESENGVCITIWQEETHVENGLLVYELELLSKSPNAGHWTNKSGHKKRIRHLSRAIDEFDGFVDVVLLEGPPGGPYESAHPWGKKEIYRSGWRVVSLNRETGGFRVEIDDPKSSE